MNSQFLQLAERLECTCIEVLQYVVVQHEDFQARQSLEVVGLQCGQIIGEECQAGEGDHMQEEISWYAAQSILAKQQLSEIRQLREGKAIDLKTPVIL